MVGLLRRVRSQRLDLHLFAVQKIEPLCISKNMLWLRMSGLTDTLSVKSARKTHVRRLRSVYTFHAIYTMMNLAIHVSVIRFASSTSPISNNNCTVPLVALSSALKIHVCVNVAASPINTVLNSVR